MLDNLSCSARVWTHVPGGDGSELAELMHRMVEELARRSQRGLRLIQCPAGLGETVLHKPDVLRHRSCTQPALAQMILILILNTLVVADALSKSG